MILAEPLDFKSDPNLFISKTNKYPSYENNELLSNVHG